MSAPGWVLDLMGGGDANIVYLHGLTRPLEYDSQPYGYRYRIIRKDSCVVFYRFRKSGEYDTYVWPDEPAAPTFDPLAAYPVAEEGRRPDPSPTRFLAPVELDEVKQWKRGTWRAL